MPAPGNDSRRRPHMRKRGVRWKLLVSAVAVGTGVGVVTAIESTAGTPPYSWAAGLPGCDPSRPAVAHHADQQVMAPQPKDGPVPCGNPTGYPTNETRIQVDNDN